jgi:serine/threonine protein kinase/Flp pilus assembly protein TadD
MEPEGPLGDFRIVRQVGRGGMGVVYEAIQTSLGRRVALKVLPFAAALDATHLQRFKNEAQAAAHLHHPNIVPVHAVGCERGVHYYAMQFIDGQTLAEVIGELRRLAGLDSEDPGGPHEPASGDARFSCSYLPAPALAPVSVGDRESALPAADTVRQPAAALSTAHATGDPVFFRTVANLAAQAAEALEHAHSLGVVHRDIKPANLLIDGKRNLWVTDFGLAQVQTDTRLTLTGDLVGTLRYMSPEQALAQPSGVSHRTDLYSLGATLYELLTLEPAFPGRDRQALLREIAFEEPRPPRRLNKAVPVELETIVLKAMAKNPAERYASARELADDLERFLKDEPIRARRPTLRQRARRWARRHQTVMWSAAVGFLVALAMLAGSVGWFVRDRAARQARIAGDIQTALKEAQQSRSEGKWPQAQAAAQRAQTLLQDGTTDPALAEQVHGLLRELAEDEADDRLVARLEQLRLLQAEVKNEVFFLQRALPDYRQAFHDYGLLPDTMTPEEAAAQLLRRPAAVRGTMVAAIDHWLILARYKKAAEADWLERVLSAADTDAWRQAMRAARERNDRPALEKLAREVDVTAEPAESLFLLDRSLRQRGALDAAVKLLRRAREAFPGDFWINHDLGTALRDCRPPQYEDAIRFLTAAVALRPDSAGAILDLGRAFLSQGRTDEANATIREAIKAQPEYAQAHYWLGIGLMRTGQFVEAAAAYRRTIELRPDFAEAHCNLGFCLRQQGEYIPALDSFKRGHELGSPHQGWTYPSARWVKECERLIELDARLPAILKGEVQPSNAAERNEYAQVCFHKKLYVGSIRLWTGAFEADPRMADALASGDRYNAACAAALAASGCGADAGQLDEQGRARWRKQALAWLRADLTLSRKWLQSAKAENRRLARQRLRHWQQDEDLAGLRDPAALALLPPDEQHACQQLWAEVQTLLNPTDSTQ